MAYERTLNANTCQTLCVVFSSEYVKQEIPYEILDLITTTPEGQLVLSGSLTFVKNEEKTLEISIAVPFDYSGGTINRWVPLPWKSRDILFVSNGRKGENLKYLWKQDWTLPELLAAHNM